MLYQTFCVFLKISRELDLALQNLLIDRHGIIVVEGVDSCDHLIGENAERPPVDGLSVPLVQQDLGREILWGTAKSIGSCLTIFGETEVSKLEVALTVDQDILRFQISVDNSLLMAVVDHG